jgi:molecular chaperone HtpG
MSTSAKDKTENLDGKHNFQAEVTRLLDIVARSLYSEKEIFLRELVSNASDACDKLRYETLTNPSLVEGDSELRIIISYDSKKRILSITDNGIGMSNQELIDNLGTIARSGTAAFVENIEQSDDVSSNLIGQFGVGFYSAFMVADNVLVTSRRAGSEAGGIWESDGKGSFTITETEKADKRGTTVELHLSKNEKEFLDDSRIINIIKTYSDHISIPIILRKEDNTEEQINSASALWTRPSNEISEDNYKEFYNHIGRMYDQPWMTIHNRVEGKIEYTNLLFIPSSQPFDLFQPDRKTNIKLYVRRVFITDDCEELIPAWLRFVRGLVDSEDLPLNISREMLQHNPVLTKIKAGLVKRIIRELKKKIKKDPEGYLSFWGNFGAVLKEGLYESEEYRKDLLEISKFPSTDKENLITLAEYVSDMAEGQEDIFYFSGSNLEAVSSSPQLEAFRKKKINVLLMVDPVDEFWLPTINEFDGKKFRSVSRGDIEIDKIGSSQETKKDNTAKDNENLSSLTALLKITLVDAVKDVRESNRLTDSAVCLVADEDDMDMHLERLLRQHKQVETASKRILEINPTHPMILDLAKTVSKKGTAATAELEDVAWLLLDQALIIEGESPPDPGAFAQRMSSIIGKGLNE